MNAEALLAQQREAEAASLWRAFKERGSPIVRETLFQFYLPVARRIARRHFMPGSRGGVEFADLLQLACTGLLEAIDRFDLDRGVPFEGYATRRISGTVLDGIASSSELRQQIAFHKRVHRERLRSVSPERQSGRPSNRLRTAALTDLAVALAVGKMLEGTGMFADGTMPDTRRNPYESLAWDQGMARLASEVAALVDRERSLIRHHYEEGLSFDVIATLFGLSKRQVLRIHQAVLATLRQRLSARRRFRIEA